MSRIPEKLRKAIGSNIRKMREEKFPGVGGGKRCAAAYGVSPQQWSPWERGIRIPGEAHMEKLAEFFGVTVAWLRDDREKSVQCNGRWFALCGELPESDGVDPYDWACDAAKEVSDVIYDFCKSLENSDPIQILKLINENIDIRIGER